MSYLGLLAGVVLLLLGFLYFSPGTPNEPDAQPVQDYPKLIKQTDATVNAVNKRQKQVQAEQQELIQAVK